MLVADGQIVINDGADVELVMQDVSPGDALTAIGALDDGSETDDDSDVPQLPRHVLVYCDAEDEERFKGDWIALRHELDSLDIKLLADGVMPRLAVTVATGAGINLLQGDYGSKASYSGMFQPWKYAAMLLLGLGVAVLVHKVTDYFVLKRELVALQEQFLGEVQRIRPGTSQVDDPVRFVGSLRNQVGTPDAPPLFLQSMESLSRATTQHASVRIDAVSYRSGIVNIRLSAPDVTTLDNIQRIVSESGQFSATIQSAEQQGESVNSQIQIEAR
jgi:general secretion pathway protein L